MAMVMPHLYAKIATIVLLIKTCKSYFNFYLKANSHPYKLAFGDMNRSDQEQNGSSHKKWLRNRILPFLSFVNFIVMVEVVYIFTFSFDIESKSNSSFNARLIHGNLFKPALVIQEEQRKQVNND